MLFSREWSKGGDLKPQFLPLRNAPRLAISKDFYEDAQQSFFRVSDDQSSLLVNGGFRPISMSRGERTYPQLYGTELICDYEEVDRSLDCGMNGNVFVILT